MSNPDLRTYTRIWNLIGALSVASRDDSKSMLRLTRSEEFQQLEKTLGRRARRRDRRSTSDS